MGIPRSWRSLHVKVRKESLTIHLKQGEKLSLFAPGAIPKKRLEQTAESLMKMTFPDRPQIEKSNALKWGPKGSIGIYVTKGSASFRKVSIVPIMAP